MEFRNSDARVGSAPRRRRSAVCNERGQAMAEAGIVITMLVLLMMGVFEFGRAFMIGNMVTNAARTGARTAALTPVAARGLDGEIVDISPIEAAAKAVIDDIVDSSAFVVTVTQIDGDVPMVQVRLVGDVSFALVPANTFSVDRAVTFPDQGRPAT